MATMLDHETAFGLPPRQNNSDEILQHWTCNRHLQNCLVNWSILNGIPNRSASAAMPSSLAKAYASPRYLAKWRTNVNPGFASMVDDDMDFDNMPSPEDEEVKPQAPRPVELPSDMAEKLAGSVAPLIKKLVSGEVEDQLAVKKLELSETAKQNIREIAKQAGLDLAAKSMAEVRTWLDTQIPPREILIKNTVTGSASNIGVQHEKFEYLLRTAQIRNHQGFAPNIWITGPTGGGKTTAAENVAKALGLEFSAESSLDSDHKVYGFFNAQGVYMRTQFRERFEHGGVYVADEIDNWYPSALTALNAPLANGFGAFPDGMVTRHKDFICIACANTWGLGATSDYVGRSKLDAASLDRFMPKMEWPIDEKLERAIAKKAAPMFGEAWHDLIIGARRKAKAQGLKIIISPRATINGIAMLQGGFTVDEAIDSTFMAGLSKDQYNNLNDADGRYMVKRVVNAALEAGYAEEDFNSEPEEMVA